MKQSKSMTIAAGVAFAPVAAWAVLYTWKDTVESGVWRSSGNWISAPGGYPDDSNDDALIEVGQGDNYQRTVEINDDCIDEFTYEGDSGSTENLLLTLISDGSGPRELTVTTVTLIGATNHIEQHTTLRVDDGAELTTVGGCE